MHILEYLFEMTAFRCLQISRSKLSTDKKSSRTKSCEISGDFEALTRFSRIHLEESSIFLFVKLYL